MTNKTLKFLSFLIGLIVTFVTVHAFYSPFKVYAATTPDICEVKDEQGNIEDWEMEAACAPGVGGGCVYVDTVFTIFEEGIDGWGSPICTKNISGYTCSAATAKSNGPLNRTLLDGGSFVNEASCISWIEGESGGGGGGGGGGGEFTGTDLQKWAGDAHRFMIGIALVASVFLIPYIAVLIGSGVPENKQKGIEWLKSLVFGLLVVLLSGAIIRIVGTDFLGL